MGKYAYRRRGNFDSYQNEEGYGGYGTFRSQKKEAGIAKIQNQVTVSAGSTNNSTAIYTVEEGKILYIQSAWITAYADAAGTGDTYTLTIKSAGGTDLFHIIGVVTKPTATATSTAQQSITFPNGLKVYPGQGIFSRVQGAGTSVLTGFYGWIEDYSGR